MPKPQTGRVHAQPLGGASYTVGCYRLPEPSNFICLPEFPQRYRFPKPNLPSVTKNRLVRETTPTPATPPVTLPTVAAENRRLSGPRPLIPPGRHLISAILMQDQHFCFATLARDKRELRVDNLVIELYFGFGIDLKLLLAGCLHH